MQIQIIAALVNWHVMGIETVQVIIPIHMTACMLGSSTILSAYPTAHDTRLSKPTPTEYLTIH